MLENPLQFDFSDTIPGMLVAGCYVCTRNKSCCCGKDELM